MAKFKVQVWDEVSNEWGPAIAGTYNQTGQSDEQASTFGTREEAEAVADELEQYDADEAAWHEREPREFCVEELDEDLSSRADLDRTTQEW